MRYLIEKGFVQLAQRDFCQQQRSKFDNKSTENHSLFVKSMNNKTPLDNSSDKDSTKSIQPTLPPNKSVTPSDKTKEKSTEQILKLMSTKHIPLDLMLSRKPKIYKKKS